MEHDRIDSKVEQQLVTAMIVSKEFLAQAVSVLEIKYIRSEPLQIIARWCVKYFNKYNDAPKHHIENKYHHWAENTNAKEEIKEAVHDLLELFSEEYESERPVNVSYLLDVLGEYLTFQKLEHTKDDLEDALLNKNKADAEKIIFEYSSVNVGAGVGINPFRNKNAWDRAYANHEKPLFTFKNKDAKKFFNRAFSRDALIAILGPEKRGKTFWCVEFAVRALMSRCTVALFEVGDMSESQILRRLGCRFSGRPMYRYQTGHVELPRLLRHDGHQMEVVRVGVHCPKIATSAASKTAIRRFMRKYGLSTKHDHFMISVHPNSSINVTGISAILDQWETEKQFIPDVVIIDYPDILDDEPGTKGYNARDKINMQWKALRRLSQERHCLVIAPTQADAKSYGADVLSMANFSEDKRKFAHVTGMLGLNQTPDEKDEGLMRLNWIVLREDDFVSSRCLHVAQCLPLARAFCCAKL